MDAYLFSLWKQCRDGHYTIAEMADAIHLSAKQTRRHLLRWQEEGWLTYTSGLGRGNVSQLVWLRHVESELAEQLLKRMETESIEAVTNQLEWDWSPAQAGRFMRQLEKKFGYSQTSSDALIIPRRRNFLTTHPLEAADIHSAHLVQNVFNRLFTIDASGQVTGELAHHYEWQGDTLVLFLRKGVRFHDGSLMTSKDVTKSLRALFQSPAYRHTYRHVRRVSSNGPYQVDVTLDRRRNSFVPRLSMIHTSIAKDTIGTGPFLLEQHDAEKTVLAAFENYFGVRALLDRVEFLQVPDGYDPTYRISSRDSGETGYISTPSGFTLVFLNAQPGGVFERDEARHYIHRLIAEIRPDVGSLDDRKIPNDRGFLGDASEAYQLPDGPVVTFDHPIRIKQTDFTSTVSMWIADMLTRHGIAYEWVPVSFKDTIHDTTYFDRVDLLVHGEIYERNTSLGFEQFLTSDYSPPRRLLRHIDGMTERVRQYDELPFEEWLPLHREIERELKEGSYFIPLYNEERTIPFPVELKDVCIDIFGYFDFAKLWIPS
ncbi:ABC transporter substrate-binding protein [Exiguobacterium chiriqhucha]|uniref:ABC transporter substrate-binding protein n=1 Tax=Exiguobacterium chiriqhucha TaxID=1385984 RepID=UPI0007375F9B|nr:ABC transporter substrate-binding protein [Exiguobacterium chiriqhucha]